MDKEDDVKLLKEEEIVPEKCWRENRRGDSRKWITSNIHMKIPPHTVFSTMKATYAPPDHLRVQLIGKRRSLFIKDCYRKSYEESMEALEKRPPVVDCCSEYNANYHSSNFQPIPEDKLYHQRPELYEKYPLYASKPTTFWLHNVQLEDKKPVKLMRNR